MTNLFKLLSIVSLYLCAHVANAGILIEPYAGASADTVTIMQGSTEIPAETNTSSSTGMRLGWGMLGLHAGIDYQMDKTDGKSNTFTGLMVSYKLPILFKAYAVKYIKANLDGTDASSGLNAMKLGVGFTGLPFVHLNLEYTTLKASTTILSTNYEFTHKIVGLTASLPFDL